MSADEQQPERPPGVDCPNCGFHFDCETATSFIQAEAPVTCFSCGLDLTELMKYFCSTESNK